MAERPRILADENIPAGLVEILREQQFEVAYIGELNPGLSDTDIVEMCLQGGMVLLTEDRDFGELVFRRQLQCAGIVLLRLPADYRRHWPRIVAILDKRGARLNDGFTVIEQDRIRVRRLPPRS